MTNVSQQTALQLTPARARGEPGVPPCACHTLLRKKDEIIQVLGTGAKGKKSSNMHPRAQNFLSESRQTGSEAGD